MQTDPLFPFALQLQEEREKQENFILITQMLVG